MMSFKRDSSSVRPPLEALKLVLIILPWALLLGLGIRSFAA